MATIFRVAHHRVLRHMGLPKLDDGREDADVRQYENARGGVTRACRPPALRPEHANVGWIGRAGARESPMFICMRRRTW